MAIGLCAGDRAYENLDPTGNHLVVGNHNTNDIFTFRVDPNTGKFTSTGYKAGVAALGTSCRLMHLNYELCSL